MSKFENKYIAVQKNCVKLQELVNRTDAPDAHEEAPDQNVIKKHVANRQTGVGGGQ